MKKIVININFGGFSLSTEAILLARELSGNPIIWNCPIKAGERYKDGSLFTEPALLKNCHHPNVERDDLLLVRVVEELGEKANGRYATLKIVSVDGKYRITDYDGYESVETPKDIQWKE